MYEEHIKVIKDGVKVNKDFEIPLLEDRAFKHLSNVYPEPIIKFIGEINKLAKSVINNACFVDTFVTRFKI